MLEAHDKTERLFCPKCKQESLIN
ncbi:cysteine-rich KTR domain-containing protein [Lachnoclostridium sp. An138]